MSASDGFKREEIAAILKRMGMTQVDEAFLERCVSISAATRKTLSMLPPPPDKSLEPSHVFAPPLSRK